MQVLKCAVEQFDGMFSSNTVDFEGHTRSFKTVSLCDCHSWLPVYIDDEYQSFLVTDKFQTCLTFCS